MTIVLDGSAGITNDGGYTGDGVVFADTTPANTLVTTTGGNVGIGGSPDADAKFQVVGGVRAAGGSPAAFNFNNGFTFQNSKDAGMFSPTNGVIGFATGGSERARFDSSGSLLVGTTSAGLTNTNSATLQTNGPGGVLVANHSGTASGSAYAFFAYNGSSIGGITQNGTTAVAYNTASDYRLKENIQPMIGALSVVAALKPVTYKWKADGSDGQGFIAHELQAVLPDCVTGEKDAVDAEGNPVYQGIDTSFLVATLTAAIQEQQQLITALTARVAALEGK